jgi:hypothetical protein
MPLPPSSLNDVIILIAFLAVKHAALETISKGIVARSRRDVRDWLGGFPRVYEVIHARKANDARREQTP